MSYSTDHFQVVLDSFQLGADSPLDSRTVRRAFAESECEFGDQEHTVFNRETTLWAFLYEMLHTGTQRTLQAAVLAVRQLRIAKGLDPNSSNTGTYAAARAKIDVAVPLSLLQTVAKNAEQSVPRGMLLCGEHVTLMDGSTDSMPDTPENQEQYPQPKSQKPGLGFPLRRFVVLISAATAMVQMVAFGTWSGKGSSELGLMTSLFDQLKTASKQIRILVADRYYCSYLTIAVLAHFGINFVTRLHGGRLIDFADAENVSRKRNGDFHVVWKRPQRPFWITDRLWEIVPETMTLRLVRVRIRTEGSRTRGFFVVTNLMDAERHPSDAIREMYRSRWHVETDLRTIKTFMSLDILRGKTPDMVDREFAMGLLAYNLVRAKMLETAMKTREDAPRQSKATKRQTPRTKTAKNKIAPQKVTARHLSFSVAMKSIAISYLTIHFMNAPMRRACRNAAQTDRAATQVGNRPNRYEPRCVKRRPKPHRLMLQPRETLRERLKRGTSPTQDGDEAATMLGE